MASGQVTAFKGRTHGCSDQACSVKILLANPEPSTHDPKLPFWDVRNSVANGGRPDMVLTSHLVANDP